LVGQRTTSKLRAEIKEREGHPRGNTKEKRVRGELILAKGNLRKSSFRGEPKVRVTRFMGKTVNNQEQCPYKRLGVKPKKG